MKNFVLCSIAALFCFSSCKKDSQPEVEVVSDFVGIWQLCGQVYNENMPTIAPYENERLPEYKIINKDGTFINLIASRETFITVYGTYDDTQLNKYIEYVEKSYTNPKHNDYKNEMDCEIINGKYMKLTYQMEDTKRVHLVNEVWIKVPYGNPFEINRGQ
jgi:hypothetical protein